MVILFLAYYLVPRRLQWGLLLVFSYIFYATANPIYLCYLILTTGIIYVASLQIQLIGDKQEAFLAENSAVISKEEKKEYKKAQKNKQRIWMIAAGAVLFGVLFLLKYTPVTTMSFAYLSQGQEKQGLQWLLVPMGISFYTLQAAGYVFDVYRKEVKAEKNFLKLALFLGFFPQLIQGPISKYSKLTETLYGPHAFEWASFSHGLQRILWGYFKKLVIADRVAIAVNTILGDTQTYHGSYMFWGMLLYTLELYADFTGGIDITIGLAECLGIRLEENFKRPYFSHTLKEYWRRWHITMCNWFRSYVFYPLSTSKGMQKLSKITRKTCGDYVGKRIPVYLASLGVWVATGVWHGAGWNFFFWGIANWLVLMLSEELEPFAARFHKAWHWNEKKWFGIFQMLRTFLLVCVLNLFDCFTSLSQTWNAFIGIFTGHNWSTLTDGSLLTLGLDGWDYALLVLGVLLMFVVSLHQERMESNENQNETKLVREESMKSVDEKQNIDLGLNNKRQYWKWAITCCILVICILLLGNYGIGYDSAQFIYNKF